MLNLPARTLYGVYSAIVFVAVVFVLTCPLILLAPTLPLRRAVGRAGVRLWLAASFIPFRVHGRAQLPPGPCIAVCNHASYLDGVLLTAALPGRFTFLVQHGAADWPYVGWVLRRMGVRFVNRRARHDAVQTTRELIERIKAGESFAIFPEGTFREIAALLPFHAGAFLIAARAGAPVVPVAMRGPRLLFGEGQKLFRWSPIEVHIGAPATAAGSGRDAAHDLRDRARAAILPLCGEADGAHLPLQ